MNISNLKWSKEYSKMTIEEAISNTPKGYRLPTVQELNTKINKNLNNFKSDYYWSSSKTTYLGIWMVSNIGYTYTTMDRNTKCNVVYVKDI